MSAYSYAAPSSIEDTLALLSSTAEAGERAQILAGGTDLLVQLRSIDKEPRLIVDVKKLDETNEVNIGSDEIVIGAAVPSAILNENAELKSLLPGLIESADLIGSTQIQGRATIGGNLCNSSPAGDTIPALIAVRAQCVIASPRGEREVAVEDFCTGVGTNCMAADEFLVSMKVPRPGPRSSDAYLRFIPRTEMDIAVAGAGVSVSFDDSGNCTAACVGIGAVAPTPLLVEAAGNALVGTTCDDAALETAAAACSAAANPISDKRGTVEYRIKVVGVLCKRAGAIARDRALA